MTNDSNVDAVRTAGFEVHGIATDAIVLFENAGYKGEAAVSATRENVNLFWRIVMPEFSSHLEEIEKIVGDAVAIVAPPWAFNAQSVAEKCGIPFIGAHLWPLGILSASDPPVLRDLPWLIRAPKAKTALIWNRFVIYCTKIVMRLMFAKYLNPPRKAYGLQGLTRTPVLDFLVEPCRTIGLYSPLLAPPAKDFPEDVDLTGFPILEEQPYPPDPELDAFLKQRPVVFSLGSILSHNPGSFYEVSVAAARSLGLKALILTGQPDLVADAPDILIRAYLPHSVVFPHALIIVHHGGIGTTAQALRAGRPQLVVPHFGDQSDNAARLEKLGLARVLPSEEYTVSGAVSALSQILETPSYDHAATTSKSELEQETGAARAAGIVLEVIADH